MKKVNVNNKESSDTKERRRGDKKEGKNGTVPYGMLRKEGI